MTKSEAAAIKQRTSDAMRELSLNIPVEWPEEMRVKCWYHMRKAYQIISDIDQMASAELDG